MSFSPLSKLGIIQNQNYIPNSDFNNFPFASNATLGWSLKNGGTPNATTKLPTSAPSAAAAGTLLLSSVSGGSQISGTVSASLSSTAATTAGDMLITDALTLDLKAQATIQSFSFSYKVSANGTGTPNFSGTSANAIGVAIYDATNAAWIQPAGVFNLVQSSGVGKASGTFQCPSNCTSVRLAVYFPNSTAASGGSPFTVIFDDFVLGPQTNPAGAAISDWVSSTPTYSNAGTTSLSVHSTRRVGDTLQIQGRTVFATAGAAAVLRLRIPSSIGTIDTTKVQTGNLAGTVGSYNAQIGGSIFNGNVNLTTTANEVSFIPDGPGGAHLGSAFVLNTELTYTLSVPISGWSSNTVLSQDTDTRVVAGSFFTTTSTVVTTGGVNITYSGTSLDTHSAFSSGTTYTVPVSGVYRVFSQALFECSSFVSFDYVDLGIILNGGSVSIARTYIRNIGFVSLNPTDVVLSLKAGDQLRSYALKASNNIGGAIYLDGGFSKFLIQRLSGPATIAASETVAASYGTSAGQSFPHNTETVVIYGTKQFDTHGMMNTSTGVVTIPISGRYLVSSGSYFGAAIVATATDVQTILKKSGVVVQGTNITKSGTSAGQLTTQGTFLVQCNAGDTISISLLQANSASSAQSLITIATLNFINVVRVGN
jgi:hypothetical protein